MYRISVKVPIFWKSLILRKEKSPFFLKFSKSFWNVKKCTLTPRAQLAFWSPFFPFGLKWKPIILARDHLKSSRPKSKIFESTEEIMARYEMANSEANEELIAEIHILKDSMKEISDKESFINL